MLRIHPISTRERSFPALGPFPVLRTVETEHPVRHKCASPITESQAWEDTRAQRPRTLRHTVAAVPYPASSEDPQTLSSIVSQSRKNGTEGADLTSGSLRPTITCEGQVWKYTGVHCKHVTSATRGQRVGGASASPEFKSKWLSCSLHIFQSAPSGGILECPGSQPSLCSLKTHFVDW